MTTPPTEPAPTGSARGSGAVRVAFLALGLVLLVRFVLRLGTVLELTALAVLLAFVTLPVQRRLAGRIGAAAATAAVAVGTFAAIVAVGGLVLRDLAGQSAHLADLLAGGVERWAPGSLPERVARSLDLEATIRTVLGHLAPTVVAGETTGMGVGRRVLDVILVVVLTAFLQGGLPGAASWVMARWPRDERAAVRAWGDEAAARAGAVVRRSLGAAVVGGALVAALARLADVPGGVVLGAWAGAWMVVPVLGPLVALAPAVAAGGAVSTTASVVMLAGGIAVVAGARVAVDRFVERPFARVGCPGWVLALGVGSSVAGVAGALAGFALAAVAAAVGATATPSPAWPGAREGLPSSLVRIDDGRVRLLSSWRGALTPLAVVTGAAVAWLVVRGLRPVVAWVAIGMLLAVALDRPVEALARRTRVGRVPAGAAVIGVAALAVVVVAVLAVRGAASAGLGSDLPAQLRGLDDTPLLGRWFARVDLADAVGRRTDAVLEDLGANGGLASIVSRAGGTVTDASWALVLAAALVFEGRRLAASVSRRVPARHRRQVDRLGTVALAAVAGYAGGAVLVAALNAGMVLTIAALSGIALAPVLAAWAFVCNFVPQVGGFLGGFPLVMLALSQGVGHAAVAGGVFVSYQFVENHVLQPALIGDAVELPGWATLLTALAGGAAAGVIGAVVLTPLVGVIHQVVRAYRRPDFPGRTVPERDAAPALAGIDT